MADTYIVTAGYVTVETAVPGGRARVDIPRGAALPDDVPTEQVETELRLGRIVAHNEREATPEKPAESAAKAKWVAWAVHKGLTVDEAEKHTKAELVELLGDDE